MPVTCVIGEARCPDGGWVLIVPGAACTHTLNKTAPTRQELAALVDEIDPWWEKGRLTLPVLHKGE